MELGLATENQSASSCLATSQGRGVTGGKYYYDEKVGHLKRSCVSRSMSLNGVTAARVRRFRGIGTLVYYQDIQGSAA